MPHTTGSAYMYSYVTVGELIAFIIGWNMVLEYLIGTSACACALSACLDALANGAISGAIANSVGTILGEYPFRIPSTHGDRLPRDKEFSSPDFTEREKEIGSSRRD